MNTHTLSIKSGGGYQAVIEIFDHITLVRRI